MSFYTGTPVNDPAKLVRYGRELQIRGAAVGEHPLFGGVGKGHMTGSKHFQGRAIDVNKSWRINDPVEKRFNDKLAVEAMRRGFGVISNRGPGDHTNHIHIETIRSRTENYEGRVRLHYPPAWRPKLKVDGIKGPKTIAALQESFGLPVVDGIMDWGGRLGKTIQAFLNTEIDARLVVDGKCGRQTQRALSRYYGFGMTNHHYITQGQWRVIQQKLNAHGSMVR